MYKLIIIVLTLISCSTDIGVIEEPKGQAPELELTQFVKNYNKSTSFRYSANCSNCVFLVEGQTLSYQIIQGLDTISNKSFPNRGQFGCHINCTSSFTLVFSNNYFTRNLEYTLITSYTLPDTDCFKATTISNIFEFKY